MGKLKRFWIIALLLSSGALCFANQISFQIVQHDDSMDYVSEDSLVIEDSVLNNFFEYGYIVTNSDAAISDSAGQDEKLYKIGQGDAFNGYSDYFVISLGDYESFIEFCSYELFDYTVGYKQLNDKYIADFDMFSESIEVFDNDGNEIGTEGTDFNF